MLKGRNFFKKQKLTEKDQFERVFAEKQKKTTKHFLAYFCKNKFDYPRLGIGVSKKNVKLATKRNFLKRIIRETFRLNQKNLDSLDLLVFVKRNAETASKEELKEGIKKQIESFL